ncbi:MAG TPA: hypothetical protein VKA98_00260 [Nitrososphaeraceae archaeon]|nr:hypothetical protein [Nitrososphaeraceae archaeon]
MTEFNNDPYSVLFAQFASKLESHLLKHGVACVDADMIIEESSILYFRKLESSKKKLFKLFKRHDPETVFIDSACQVMGRLIPEAKQNFGSYNEVSKCIH